MKQPSARLSPPLPKLLHPPVPLRRFLRLSLDGQHLSRQHPNRHPLLRRHPHPHLLPKHLCRLPTRAFARRQRPQAVVVHRHLPQKHRHPLHPLLRKHQRPLLHRHLLLHHPQQHPRQHPALPARHLARLQHPLHVPQKPRLPQIGKPAKAREKSVSCRSSLPLWSRTLPPVWA